MTQADDGKLRLMVVDDESDNLDLLYRSFRQDFHVFKADSALTALQILNKEGEMGIIISDQRMPKMSGTEFLSRAAKQYPDTIRILLTGYTDVEDLVNAINAGQVFKYITKPWNPDALETIVRQAADTYRVVKRRTNELHQALRRESIFNTVTTATRDVLDYQSMLQRIVETLALTFAADACRLAPIDVLDREDRAKKILDNGARSYRLSSEEFGFSHPDREVPDPLPSISADIIFSALENRRIQQLESHQPYCSHLVIPLTFQQEALAVVTLYRHDPTQPWAKDDVNLIQEVAERLSLAVFQAKLYQQTQQQSEQMQAELEVARQIQTNLLRQKLPELDTVRIQACCQPARAVGGDFFEVYVHPQGDIWVGVGDVSGKGVPAALFMASAISVLRRELSQETPPLPNIVLQNLNNSLFDDLVSSNRFITMALARYSPHTKTLVYANAGHIYPLIWSKALVKTVSLDSASSEPLPEPTYLTVRGVPLGILPLWQAESGSLPVKPGDVFLLTSDGITEARPGEAGSEAQGNQTMLQQSGLWQLLVQHETLNLAETLANVQAHSPIQEDDQTILSLEIL